MISGKNFEDFFPGLEADNARESLTLVNTEGCRQAEEYLRSTYYLDLKKRYQNVLDGYNRRLSYGPSEQAVPEAIGAEDSSSSPGKFTKTNNQVQGVDEGDVVKTTGSHMFVIADGGLRVLQTWPVSDMKQIGYLPLDDYPIEMLISPDEKKLLIVANPRFEDRSNIGSVEGDSGALLLSQEIYYRSDFSMTSVRVYQIDIADKANPRVLKTSLHRGSFRALRLTGPTFRLVVSESLGSPAFMEPIDYQSLADRMSANEYKVYLDALLQRNYDKLIQASFGDLLPGVNTSTGQLKKVDDLVQSSTSCEGVYTPTVPSKLGVSSIISIGATETVEPTIVSLLSNSFVVYASQENIYFSAQEWGGFFAQNRKTTSFVHKFTLGGGSQVEYSGSGKFEGYPLNQFAFDEYEGHLRIARTVSENGGASFVSVFSQEGLRLRMVGNTEPLGVGERIFAVRFMGARGFVVTFRQVDPLYTLDLKSPTNPLVLGELKIPGFSNYLHPISETHLIGIGQDADPRTGRALGLKVSLFDVSDMSKPAEKYIYTIDNSSYSQSVAQYDHKVFTYYSEKGLLAIPVSGIQTFSEERFVDWTRYFQETEVLKIDIETGISKFGSLSMAHPETKQGKSCVENNRSSDTKLRNLFADHYMYALEACGIQAFDLNHMGAPEVTVEFD